MGDALEPEAATWANLRACFFQKPGYDRTEPPPLGCGVQLYPAMPRTLFGSAAAPAVAVPVPAVPSHAKAT